MRVVSHDDDVLAAYLPIGTRYFGILPKRRETAYEEFARGELRWGECTWHSHNVLMLVRPGDAYSILGFWNEEGTFVSWYVNLQDPLRWTSIGFDTLDHALDIIVGEDLRSWLWKDEHELEISVEMGMYSRDQAVEVRNTGEAVIEALERGEAWWRDWRSFTPVTSWELPALPDGWDVL